MLIKQIQLKILKLSEVATKNICKLLKLAN